ncbi:uncharacterized protein LOC110866508 [Helianthus annuus]|uniref:uncharacterized protein LOC110866508 n=1 Tax=Helianthus annuus TaxID=4232 RepID=UPI000B8FA654|nr:uncharacterized protein LOC110866508 [Helianthus annuus]
MLKGVLGEVISEYQLAFIKRKYSLDKPLVVNEIITWCKKINKQVYILKIDFEKAYDNVNWNFVIDTMRQMEFPGIWCDWIHGVLESARSAVLVNGAPTFEFQCGKARDGGVVHGIKTPNYGPIISHLLYADDAIIIGEWEAENLLNVVRILRVFYMCYVLKINLKKSNLYGIRVLNSEVKDKAKVVG